MTNSLEAIGSVQLQLWTRLAQACTILRSCNDGDVQHLAWGGEGGVGQQQASRVTETCKTYLLGAASVPLQSPWGTHRWRGGTFLASRKYWDVMSVHGGGCGSRRSHTRGRGSLRSISHVGAHARWLLSRQSMYIPMRCGAMAEEENVRGAGTRNVFSGLRVGRLYSMRWRSRNGAWCGAVMVACRRSGAAAAMARLEYSDMDIGCGFPWSSTRLPFLPLRRPCPVHPTHLPPAVASPLPGIFPAM